MTDTRVTPSSPDLITGSIRTMTDVAECYHELAEQMETCNNPVVAATFSELSELQQQLVRALDSLIPDTGTHSNLMQSGESPETRLYAGSHYLMHPWHAINLALETERELLAPLLALADSRSDETTTDGSAVPGFSETQQISARVTQHLDTLSAMLSRQPVPDADWHLDPDPPMLDD